MRARALILTYHAVESGPAPLCIDPRLFEAHLDLIVGSGIRTVSLDTLAEELRAGGPCEPAVAITFDDGYASVADRATALLAQRGLPATVFCVAGHLGRENDWASQPKAATRLRLASARALSEAATAGLELGCHGIHHEPLVLARDAVLRSEILDSRAMLEQAIGAPVRWFAYPYGLVPAAARALVAQAYDGACVGGNRTVRRGDDRFLVPRVDAHYLRRPALLRRTLRGDEFYLLARRLGARLRRLVRPDFAGGASGPSRG